MNSRSSESEDSGGSAEDTGSNAMNSGGTGGLSHSSTGVVTKAH